MKIRIFKRLVDGVFDIRIQTEDWSENDRELMVKYGEPEINLGGTFTCVPNDSSDSSESSGEVTIIIPDTYVRIMTESPFVHKFDSRDCLTIDNAKYLANAWATAVESRIAQALTSLRNKSEFFATEEISEY